MATDVNMGEYLPHKDNEKTRTSRGSRSPRKGKPPSGNSRGTEHARKPELEGSEMVKKTSAFQGKVNALKVKKRELTASQFYSKEGELPEDALVNPQLRTYLTEEVLECSGQNTFPRAERETYITEELWGKSSGDDTAEHFSRNRPDSSQDARDTGLDMWPQDDLQASSPELSGNLQHSSNLSLAERVERNRQELRSKLNKTTCHGVETQHGWREPGPISKRGSGMTHVEADGDSGVSLPVSESHGELSVRHEQAKQLLHRARMKAKGASPLRASHCVSIQPQSQPPLRRSRCTSGAATDGGSLSDSSSSDYCSWNRGSRGTSPSHVRFQDESEREAEERYRERQQQGPQPPCANATPPLKRHSSGHVSLAQHLSPSGNEHCGACGSYLNGSGANQVPGGTPQRTSARNIQLGLRITQEGPLSCPLGTKPSPHWILPSQPWRIHTELIRETHIGGDSTANSSEEEEGIRSQSKNSPNCDVRRNSRNIPLTASPRISSTPYTPNQGTETSVTSLKPVTGNRIKEHTSIIERPTQNPPSWKPSPFGKTSDSNLESQTNTRSYHRTQTVSQDVDCRAEIKPAGVAINPRKELSMLSPTIVNGNALLNTDARECTNKTTPNNGKAQALNTAACTEQTFAPLDVGSAHGNLTVSGHVPVPPTGRAKTTVPSRMNRFTMRPEGNATQLSPASPQAAGMLPMQDAKNMQHNSLPKAPKDNIEATGDSQQCLQPLTKAKDERTGERPHKSRKLLINENSNKSQDHHNLQREQKEDLAKRNSDCEIPHPTKEQIIEPKNSSGDQRVSDRHSLKNQAYRQQRHSNNSGNGIEICQSTHQENHMKNKIIVQETKEDQSKADVDPCGPQQPAIRKGDMLSGMRKIFSSFGLTSRPRLDRFQSSSLEQISHAASGYKDVSIDGNGESGSGVVKPSGMKKSPSLQSLKLMSPFHLPRKASSVQNLLGKSDRSAVYVTGDDNTAPRRTLSVEDIGSPAMARVVGRVAEIYPDGTRLLELQRPPKGSFGFTISSGNGRPDSGVYVQDMVDADTAKLYSGLLRVGDEILELNGTKVSTLGHAQLNEIMTQEPTLTLRVLHQRRTKC